jgi:hypothetical protein
LNEIAAHSAIPLDPAERQECASIRQRGSDNIALTEPEALRCNTDANRRMRARSSQFRIEDEGEINHAWFMVLRKVD